MARRPYELTSVVFSHYVEKARWALDRYAVPYVEHKFMPVFHFPAVYRVHRGRAGKTDRASSRLSTPVLRTPSGRVLADSADIVRYVSDTHAPPGAGLYPEGLDQDADATAMAQRLHDRLGPHGRRVVYGMCFRQPELLARLAEHNVGPAQRAIFGAIAPAFPTLMRRLLKIDEAAERRSREVCRRELDWVSDVLADGRPYLWGERFTALDLAFACMASACVIPEEYGVWLPHRDDLAHEARALVDELRATPAGAFALRMFREERHRVLRAG